MSDFHDRRRQISDEPLSPRALEQLQQIVAAAVEERVRERSDEEIDAIAEKAATKAVDKLTDQAYRAVGKTIVQKLLYIVGLLAAALGAWAFKNGWIKP